MALHRLHRTLKWYRILMSTGRVLAPYTPTFRLSLFLFLLCRPLLLLLLSLPSLIQPSTDTKVCAARCRFREAVQDDEKPLWECKGEGIAPLQPDTEIVQNINEHR